MKHSSPSGKCLGTTSELCFPRPKKHRQQTAHSRCSESFLLMGKSQLHNMPCPVFLYFLSLSTDRIVKGEIAASNL